MRADRESARYRVQTLAGDGAGTEIWTLLTPAGPHRTAIEVRYYLPERDPERLEALAEKYRRQLRASVGRGRGDDDAPGGNDGALPLPGAGVPTAPIRSVPLSELRQRVPVLVEYDGEPFRIIEIEGGTLVAHATICPHWLGPLEEAAPQNRLLRCPWHGYLFDMRTG